MSVVTNNDKVKNIAGRVKEVAVLPQVVFQVIQMTGDANAGAKDIEKAVSIDPGLSARILTLANSAYYALPRQVTSIREAVVFLGFKSIRQLAMTAGCFEMFVGKTDKDSLRYRGWWRHALDTAVCAKLIATHIPEIIPEEAYAAGLLHDIGQNLLARYGKEDYKKVEILIEAGLGELEAEESVYGCNHTEIGSAVTADWRFPEMLIDSIGYHHHSPADLGEHRLSAVVAVADYLPTYLDMTKDGNLPVNDNESEYPYKYIEPLGINLETMDKVIASARASYDSAGSLAGLFQ